ncbi:MAG: response regulator [Bacteriovoracaceae bacterium]|nr:response regulator [Bacteriovoracaceae bacterium]
MKDNEVTQNKRTRYLILSFLFLFIIYALTHSFLAGRSIIKKQTPLVDAIMEAKLEVALAHLWFEEFAAGDKTAKIHTIQRHLDEALWYIDVLVKGGKKRGRQYYPIDDEQLIKKIIGVKALWLDFVGLVHARLAQIEQSGIGSDIDQHFDEVFKTLLKELSVVEKMIYKKIVSEQGQYDIVHELLIAAVLLSMLVTLVFLYKHDLATAELLSRIRESERLLQQSQKGANIGSWSWNLKTKHVVWSDQLYEIYGRRVGQGIPSMDLPCDCYYPEDKKRLQEVLGTTIKQNAPYIIDYRIIRSDNGQVRWLSAHGQLEHDESGNPFRLIGVARDVTDQKQMEVEKEKIDFQLRQSHKMKSIGLLAGGIAHDFNNILAALLGYLNLALHDQDLKDNTKKLLSSAENGAIRAKDLIAQLMTFSQGGTPIKEITSLESVLKESASFVLHGQKVDCQFNIPEDLKCVEIDKVQFGQVIQNIVLNASHAMPTGGTVLITCENVFGQKEEMVKICIKDSGVGMPQEVQEMIFDPYFTTKQEGSGLGLAITFSIINKHDGRIEVESTSGVGSTFTIYLPASNKDELPQQKSIKITSSVYHARILVMDDEEIVRDMVKTMLTTLGHEVWLSKNGQETIEIFKKAIDSDKKFDLVIMDLTIPGEVGGKETIQKILQIAPEAKVLVSSGYSNDPILTNYKDYGFCAQLAKPYQLEDLEQKINQIISG